MKISDAAKILGISGAVNPTIVKKAYRVAAMTYHPDRNPAGGEMMKIINAAYEVLKDYSDDIPASDETTTEDYPQAVNEALNAVIHLAGLIIEICGAWVWVSGETFTHKAVLKEAGFKFAPQKKSWYFRPEDWRSFSRGALSMDDIRDRYGSSKPRARKHHYLNAKGA